jgi:hypothetical protein
VLHWQQAAALSEERRPLAARDTGSRCAVLCCCSVCQLQSLSLLLKVQLLPFAAVWSDKLCASGMLSATRQLARPTLPVLDTYL